MDVFTGHGLVLLAIAREPCSTIRRLSDVTNMTERSVQRIVNDLRKAGYLHSSLVGRRNVYQVITDARLREAPDITAGHLVSPLVK